MSGCLKCEDLRTEYRIREPWQLKKAIRVVLSNVEDNSIQVDDYWPVGQVGSASTIDDLRSDGFWGDGIEMYFRCTACGQLFVLACETYHGSGGKWQQVRGHRTPTSGAAELGSLNMDRSTERNTDDLRTRFLLALAALLTAIAYVPVLVVTMLVRALYLQQRAFNPDLGEVWHSTQDAIGRMLGVHVKP